jgi:transmembrane sensor
VRLSRFKPDALVRRQARIWFGRIAGEPSPEMRARFERWYHASRRHADAFNRLALIYEGTGMVRHTAAGGNRDFRFTARPRPMLPAPAWATAAVFATIVLGGLVLRPVLFRSDVTAVMLATDLGEIREVRLADGSRVTLDTKSAVRVQIDRRRRVVTLERGRARFVIAAGAAPFIVRTGTAEISSHEAILDVTRERNDARVDLLSGAARIESVSGNGPAPAELQAPAEVQDPGEPSQRAGSPPAAPANWPSGILEFASTPLDEAVRQVNRYSRQQIALVDPEAQSMRVTAVLKAGDAPRAAKAISRAFGLPLARDVNGNWLIGCAPPLRRQKDTHCR